LDGIDISCAAGEICGVLGANGAGKSTLFKIITGLVAPTAGEVKIRANSPKPIGGIIEKPSLYPYLNAAENVRVFAKMQGLPTDQQFIEEKLTQVGLSLEKKYIVSKYSMGMKQRLGIAIALLNHPKSLILDEPFSGLDPLGILALRELIRKLAYEEGIAIIISSHIMEQLLSLCHKLYVLKNGKLVNSGEVSQLMEEHIQKYEITAEQIQLSEVLRSYVVDFVGDRAIVSVAKDKVPELLLKLLQEGYSVTGCKAIWNMESLF
jgi:ABC-2 type transport system ATP-binding protein